MNTKSVNNAIAFLEEKLMASDTRKLVDVLLSLYQDHEEIRKKIDIVFADISQDAATIIRAIKKEISALKRSIKCIDYNKTGIFAKSLDDLRLRINELYEKSPHIAFDFMLELADAHSAIFSHVFDDNGIVMEVFSLVCKDLGVMSRGVTHLSSEEIVDVVFLKFMRNEYGVFDDIIAEFSDTLKEKGLALLENKLKGSVSEENNRCIKLGLKAIADCKNDVQAYIEACSFSESICDHDHLEIARRLIKHQRGKDAIDWLDRMALPKNHSWNEDRSELKIQAFEIAGEHENAQNERLSLFKKSLKSSLYHDIVRCAPSPELQRSFKAEAIKKAFLFEVHAALNFLIEIQELREAVKLVYLRCKEFDGEFYYALKPAAEALQVIDPIAGTLLYRAMIHCVLKKAVTKYYKYGIEYLMKCKLLDAYIAEWADIEKHDDYVARLQLEHRLKKRFWSDYETKLLSKKSFKFNVDVLEVL